MFLVLTAPIPLPVSPDSASRRRVEAELSLHIPTLRAVIAAVLAVGRDHADVADGVGETTRRAVEGASRLRAEEPVRPWLVGIARHVALDARRARGRALRRADRTEAGTPENPLDMIASQRPDPFEALARAESDARVREALEALPDHSRKALTLFHLDGLRYEEIGERLGVPMGTVATWIARGRKALQGELERKGVMQ
jgi:RNA polymerase sigma factor (sigma-70 family)